MEKQNRQAEIVIKLLSSGRYIWSIGVINQTNEIDDTIQLIKKINNKLQEEFPEYAKRSTGRIGNLESEDL